MKDKDYYVFIEVRMRQNPEHGSSAESVTLSKQRRIIRSALHYLQKNDRMDKVDRRFDVLAIDEGILAGFGMCFRLEDKKIPLTPYLSREGRGNKIYP